MCLATPNHCMGATISGVFSTASTSPVCSPSMSSVAGTSAIRKPAACHAATTPGSASGTFSFCRCRSAGVRVGSRVKKCTQPAAVHIRILKPRRSNSSSIRGRSRSVAYATSSSFSNRNGMPSASTPGYTPARPIAEMAAASNWPVRILRSMSVSSPATPPGKTVTSMSPPESRFHSAPICCSALSHSVSFGARLANFRFCPAAPAAASASSTTHAHARRAAERHRGRQ